MLPKVTMKSGLKLPKKHQKHGVYVPMWTKSHQDVLLGSTIYTTLYKVRQETLFFSNPHFFFLIVFFNESTVDLQCYFLVHSKVSDSVTHTHTHTHIYIFFFIFFSTVVSYRIFSIVLHQDLAVQCILHFNSFNTDSEK